MIDLSPYDEYLIPTKQGLSVSENCPEDVLKELKEINSEYKKVYGEKLLQFNFND